MVIELQPLDYYVYVCLKNTINNNPKLISKYLKIDLGHIYNSLNKLIKINKIQKTKTRPAEYMLINEKMDTKEDNLERIKQDPALLVGLVRTLMNKSKVLRKLLIKSVIEKEHQKDAIKEWKTINDTEKDEWINKNYLGDKISIDTFINACYMMKNTKDEKIMLRYIMENTKK